MSRTYGELTQFLIAQIADFIHQILENGCKINRGGVGHMCSDPVSYKPSKDLANGNR